MRNLKNETSGLKQVIQYIVSAAITLILLCPISNAVRAEEKSYLRIVSYNVENLFDTKDDSLKNDDDFLPEGLQHWTYHRYRDKLSHIAQVISGIGEWQAPAIVGLVEVENDSCLYDLCRWHLKRRFYPYKYVLEEGRDLRGINPAILYDSTRLQLIYKEPIAVDLGGREQPTRDILHCLFAVINEENENSERLHIYVCHFPSQRGGTAETNEKREIARCVLKQHIVSLLTAEPEAQIIAMGDFNSAPADNIPPLVNLMTDYLKSDKGTHKFHGTWTCLDQFYVSESLIEKLSKAYIFSPEWLLTEDEKYMGKQPYRTYIGPRYLGGYSDHLPIYIDLGVE